MSAIGRVAVFTAALLGLMSGGLAVAPSAHASGARDSHGAQRALEILLPDTRVEFGESGVAAVLSFPAHSLINGRPGNSTPRDFWVSVFLEPQLQLAESEFRGLLGSRLWVPFWDVGSVEAALIVEAAGVAGTDGHGGTAGVGFCGIETGAFGASFLGLIYRYVITTEGPRHDIGLDLVTIPL